MPVEYDLVIIGYTPEGVYAALNAVSLQARVALVSQNCSGRCYPFYSYALKDLARQYHQWNESPKTGFARSVDRSELKREIARIERAIALVSEQKSPAVLSAAGVDFIEGMGEFCRRPRLAFIAGERKLRSRSYLLTMGTRPLLPTIKNLPEVGYLTPDLLWKSQNLEHLPQNLAIVGGTPLAIELAQSLTRLGKKITLIIEDQFLSSEESEATRIILAQLEIEGIAILTYSPVTQVQQISQKKWLQVGDNAIEVDEIIWAVGNRPNLDGLNLEGLGIDPQNPRVNLKQQIYDSKIYLCSAVESNFELPQIARYQADIALYNALYLPLRKSDRQIIPCMIFTDPTLTRVGTTESEAKQKHGNKVIVYRHYFKQVPRAILEEEMTGLLKIIVDWKGRVLGATIVGKEAGELINVLSLAIQNQMNIDRLNELYCISPSFSEIIEGIAKEWQCNRLRQRSFKNYLRRLWFYCCRGN